ncbi:hypothetical protein CK221_06220, partial [Mesorhizobium sp. WSM3868]
MHVAQKWIRFWGSDMRQDKDLKRVVPVSSNTTRFSRLLKKFWRGCLERDSLVALMIWGPW